MTILPLVQLSRNEFTKVDSVLRMPAKEVNNFDEDFQRTVDDLIETLCHHEIAIGLSAPQVGIPLRVSIINLSQGKTDPHLILVNPKVLRISGKKDKKKESCMSVPHYRGEVERRYKISISFQDRFGKPQSLDTQGFLARVIAHEIDHLEGVLYIDKIDDLSTLEPVDFFK